MAIAQRLPKAAARTRPRPPDSAARTYDRVARFYDIFTAPMEALGGQQRRRRLLAHAHGHVLEVGVGTGANLGLYPPSIELTGVDISTRMLQRARQRAERSGLTVELELADVHALPYPDSSFDTVTATCLLCSVADPVAALRELARVTRLDGTILLLEHVRPANPLLGLLADAISPLTQRAFGPAINRRTEQHVHTAGIRPVDVRRESVWREIRARPPVPR